MEKTKKMGDGVCCPVGEECPPEPPKPEDITGSVKRYKELKRTIHNNLSRITYV